MNFLQPLMLALLPLISLPIIIHLINQRRYQTMRWGAMMFLLQANRMSRGYARLRQWLILLFRTLAIAALIFAVSRPLSSGWLELFSGGRADTTIVLLDRSPSMQQQSAGAIASKLETGRQQLAQALGKLGSARWVLIDSATNQARELESPDALLDLPMTQATSAAADLPAMLETARQYIDTNETGRTEIWICSDLRENDWNADSGRWQALRDRFLQFKQGVRFHLLAYPQLDPGNVAVRLTDLRRRQTSDNAELLVSLLFTRGAEQTAPTDIPVQFEIDGARSEVSVQFSGRQYELKDYRLPLAANQHRGWGRVSIPADLNAADNEFYFVFDDPPPRRAIIVANDPRAAHPLEIAASIAPDPGMRCVAEVIGSEQLATVAWEDVSLLLWQSRLPRGSDAEIVQSFVRRGGRVVFLPPRVPDDASLFGVRWESWADPAEDIPVESWRGDQDLLAHTLSGASLPVGQLKIRNYCQMSGEMTSLALLAGGVSLLARVTTEQGGVYFCGTTPDPGDSSLAAEGIVLYVAIQRALAEGAESLGNTRQLVAGEIPPGMPTDWDRLDGPSDAISVEYPFQRGVYTSGERLLAVNRPLAEDQANVAADGQIAELFRGLEFVRVDDRAGNLNWLIHEIWRLFLAAMIVALIAEAILCLPRVGRETNRSALWRPPALAAQADGGPTTAAKESLAGADVSSR